MQMPSSVSTRLQYQHKSLLDIIDGLTDEQVRRPIITGKWSIFENIVHLQTYQHTFIFRVRQILEGHKPAFDRYTAEADPLFIDNCSKSSREVMQYLLTVRKEMAAEIISFPEEKRDIASRFERLSSDSSAIESPWQFALPLIWGSIP